MCHFYRTVPFSIFSPEARSQQSEALIITVFWFKSENLTVTFFNREPLRSKNKTIFCFLVKKREPYRNKNHSVCNFNREPYRNQIRSVYRFINCKNGKIVVFWYGTVRAFSKKSKNGTLFRTPFDQQTEHGRLFGAMRLAVKTVKTETGNGVFLLRFGKSFSLKTKNGMVFGYGAAFF